MRAAWFDGPEHLPLALSAEPARAAALLLHGFPGTPAELRPLGEALSASGVSAFAPLLPGFGPAMHRISEVGLDDWLAAAAQAWYAVRAAHARPVLIGYSMGAALALRLAATYPPERLVLIAPLWRMLGAAWPVGALLPVLKHLQPSIPLLGNAAALDQPELRQFFARATPNLDLDDAAVRAELRNRVRIPTGTLADVWRLGISSGAAARRVRVPTLIVQGLADRVVWPADTRALGRLVTGPVELHELPTGHLLLDAHAPAWSEVRSLILDFVG
jgi:carboxylesterase